MTTTQAPSKYEMVSAFRAQLAAWIFDGSVTLVTGIDAGCVEGVSVSGVAHDCDEQLFGSKPTYSKWRWQYTSAAYVANVDHDGTVRCGRDGCEARFTSSDEPEMAHVIAKGNDTNGSYCGLNLVLTCSRYCNNLLDGRPELVRADYNFFIGKGTQTAGQKVKASYASVSVSEARVRQLFRTLGQ